MIVICTLSKCFTSGADSDKRPAAAAGTDHHQQTAAVGMHGGSRVSKDKTKPTNYQAFMMPCCSGRTSPCSLNCYDSIRGVGGVVVNQVAAL
jgi:hypothetical protein